MSKKKSTEPSDPIGPVDPIEPLSNSDVVDDFIHWCSSHWKMFVSVVAAIFLVLGGMFAFQDDIIEYIESHQPIDQVSQEVQPIEEVVVEGQEEQQQGPQKPCGNPILEKDAAGNVTGYSAPPGTKICF